MGSLNTTLIMNSILLMGPQEQAELFAAIRVLQNDQLTQAATDIAAGAKDQPIEKRVEKYVKIRDARAASNKINDTIDAAFKGCLEAIEASLLADAHAKGVTGFKTDAGTVYTEERMQASIADDAVFFDFVRASGDLDFFERRLKVAHIKEFAEINGGQVPPGLNIFRELSVKVRRT